ncbi:MAG TPA: glycosyltransferase family 4 protein [Candidatus Peribacteraceae bacterium]|nr:glycosyltransferase family 4 protein [Candidatus Peribacteraceae bacterium]
MKVVLATGIYPPEIGGPATYVEKLAKLLKDRGVTVTVIAYGEQENMSEPVPVVRVSRKGNMITRWRRYARALCEHASSADIVYAFSSISCGVPLWMSKLKSPRKILRLGGDFFWERYTDRGGDLGLKEWYAKKPFLQGMMNGILNTFDHIVFSTQFQEELYEKVYRRLPLHHVIENALPEGTPVLHEKHDPFRLLYLGRFVAFKNLHALILSLHDLPAETLTIVGSGPMEDVLKKLVADEKLDDRVRFLSPLAGPEKTAMFLGHDLLVLPSLTEISPNTALEARSAGLPVLLTEETGLSRLLSDAVQMRQLRTPRDIANAVRDIELSYPVIAERCASAVPERSWDSVAEEHIALFRSLL